MVLEWLGETWYTENFICLGKREREKEIGLMVSSTKVEDFPSYKLNRFARKLTVNFCERDKKYVSSFKCRDTCSAVQVNRLNEWVERGGKCHRISYPELYKNSSSVIFTDFIRSDLLIFIKKKKILIPEFRSYNELRAKLISHFDSKLHSG